MLIKVKVFPQSKKERILQKKINEFEVRVREKPKNGMANKAVARVLSSYFNIPIKNIWLIKGRQQRNKIFEIRFAEGLKK